MKQIFERGQFSSYRIDDSILNEARVATRTFSSGGRISARTAVFLSHKHSDLVELKDIIGFLRKTYNIDVYIDSMDERMPKITSGETATRIKDIIKKCDKFILLATDDAIESKWCNWELGFGDAHKYQKNIALFPIKNGGTSDIYYKGNEYMEIYPHIIYSDGTDKYKDGRIVPEGYYVFHEYNITPLYEWLKK